ncbi:MAG: hypothetical protein ACI9SD_001316 [Pseudohongiellaceae bacterium]|jgi:hypothetical protein
MKTIIKESKCLCTVYFIFFLLKVTNAQVTYEKKIVNFNLPDGLYTNEMLANDFGNGKFRPNLAHTVIENNTLKIIYQEGLKVHKTGVAVQPIIEPRDKYTLQYRIKYPSNFEEGLHGKQFGFGIGVVYNGGRSDEARNNGDGGSVRIQFDAHRDSISNQLYVYSCEMKSKYGYNAGNQKYSMLRGVWNTIKLTVTMQSSVDKADGRIEVWCNDIKKIDVDSLYFVRKESARKITKLAISSFPGGGGVYPSYENYLLLDDFQWSN